MKNIIDELDNKYKNESIQSTEIKTQLNTKSSEIEELLKTERQYKQLLEDTKKFKEILKQMKEKYDQTQIIIKEEGKLVYIYIYILYIRYLIKNK